MSSLTANSEHQFFELSNCTEVYLPSKDVKYADCVSDLFNHLDACNYLKDLHQARSYSHYAIGLIPLIISIPAFLINVIFIYICVYIIKDKTNPCRRTYLFNLTRSISSITGLLVYYCILITWKMEKLENVVVVILFTIGCFSFFLQAMSYLCMAKTIELGCIIAPENYHLVFTMKYYITFFKLIWIFSLACSVISGFLYYFLRYEVDCTTMTIIQCTIMFIAPLLAITNSTLILTNFYMLRHIRKLRENNEESVRHINTKNNIVVYRLIYVTTNCILTKFSLIVIAVFCYISIDDLDDVIQYDYNFITPICQRFLHAKTYIKIFIFGGITLISIMIGMITDPVISFLCDYQNIQPLLLERYELWKRKIDSLRNGKQEDE